MFALLDTDGAGAVHATTKRMARKELRDRDNSVDRVVTLGSV
jgi:hypothetical protein